MKLQRLPLNRDAAKAVSQGHPWVYRDGVRGSAPVGSPIGLEDHKGRIKAFGLFDEGPIAVRVLGSEVQELPALIKRRVQAADRFRFQVVGGHTDTWRVINGAGDGLPGVVVDRYDSLAVLRLYSKAWEPHLELLVKALSELPWVGSVLRRLGVRSVDGRKGSELLFGPDPGDGLVVHEHGIKLLVRPHHGQKTGLFLDQRENRRRVGELAPGRRVVNLFGYNGGFSIYAAMAGAARVETVDISAPALEDAKEIFRLNGLDPRQHGFLATDVFTWTPKGRPDLLICDPPSLTHGKQSDQAARRAYRDLAAKVGPQVSSEGLLATASCTARLTRGQWEKAIAEGLAESGPWSWLEGAGAPADHPVALAHSEGRYLKFAVLRRR
ncbi:MAG: class I SAM-dependent rRNA methyltransferase [Myxococcota bacterium]|nr:class I SAM-dependent rRNA methyltransferase [Myxococcota bacterium]